MADGQVQSLLFGDRFLEDHAGHLVTDPRIAVTEIVANAYDAGATRVAITWPTEVRQVFQVEDNGTGMSLEEFQKRWMTLTYNRTEELGRVVQFPKGTRKKSHRIAFGQNGKGRHAAFCFHDSYCVETWKDGKSLIAEVEWTRGDQSPFRLASIKKGEKGGHGTRIWGKLERHYIEPDTLAETLGSKFLVDPSFTVFLNGRHLELVGLRFHTTHTVPVTDLGYMTVHRVDAPAQDRTAKLRGITYWVQRRIVGQPSWDGLDEQGAILDGRTQAAKRHSFIVESDLLDPSDVKDDWSGFHDNKQTLAIRGATREFVMNQIDNILAESRRERKIEALSKEREILKSLPSLSQKAVGEFMDEIQRQCPLLTDKELAKAAQVFTKLEQARSGYELLHKLAACSPEDMDTWNRIMEDWSASSAKIVLTELKRRLDLIEELQGIVNDKKTDELHLLQPLFARGLWVFGPEYESSEFTSNRQLITVMRELLGGTDQEVPPLRPDFVVLPDRSVGVYSADAYDSEGDVVGLRKVLLVELKRGGSTLTFDEVQQGLRYPSELKKGNSILKDTMFSVFVLGSRIGPDAENVTSGLTVTVTPLDYDTILRRAHARTFNLHRKLSEIEPTPDPEVVQVISDEPLPLFEQCEDHESGRDPSARTSDQVS